MKTTSAKLSKGVITQLVHSRTAVFGILTLGLMAVLALVVPAVSPFHYAAQNIAFANQAPFSTDPIGGAIHWFGTDELGRDIFVRLWYGMRISLSIAMAVALIDTGIGVLYGGISGFLGGVVDQVMMRLVEIISGIPYIIVVLLLVAVFPRGLMTLILAYSLTGWTGTARLVRGQVLYLNRQEFILSAKGMGAGPMHIITCHMIPNMVGLIIVNITLDIPSVIFTEAFLSLLGLGIAPPQSSLGIMANQGISVFQSHPEQLFFPAFCICLITLCFNLLGDRLSDAFDNKTRR